MALCIKICGLTTAESLETVIAAGADMAGFVFFPPSPRHLDFAAARALALQAGARIAKVALFVDADDAYLAGSIEALRPHFLQLHGRESPARVAAVKARFSLPVMKAIPVAEAADLALVPAYVGVADRLIFDARAPRDATRPGGLGTPFDWRLLQQLDPGLPFMLSGGLDAGNVAEALAITRAPGVDVSSGVERGPGDKDPVKIKTFVRAARAAEAAMPHLAPNTHCPSSPPRAG